MFILKLAGKILLLPVWLILFVIGLAVKMTVSKNDSTDLCGCQRNPWIYIHFIDYSDCILLP